MWSKRFLREILRILPFVFLLVSAGCGNASNQEEIPEIVDYHFHIRPIFSDRCYVCHGPDANARQADLRLDEEYGAKETRLASGGYAIVSGIASKTGLLVSPTAPSQSLNPGPLAGCPFLGIVQAVSG